MTTLTAGTALLMWMGELITQRGIGNGISLLIFASILVSAPPAITAWLNGTTFEQLMLPLITLGRRRRRGVHQRGPAARSRSSTPSGWSAGA